MSYLPILELKESLGRRWRYPANYTDGTFRLFSVEPLLDKTDPSIILYECRDPRQKPSYAAVSHVWRQSREVNKIAKHVNRPLEVEIEGDRTHIISWHGIVQAAVAAKHLGCDYIWLDFLCLHQTSKGDKKLQIRNMGNIYQSATAVLVMPGGVSAAQRCDKSAGWIHRAWTLQESTLCANTYVLLDWPRRYSMTIGGIEDAVFDNLGNNTAIIRLLGLLEARVSPEDVWYEIDGEEIEGIEFNIECFGNDTKSMMALWAMLEAKGDPYVLKSAAWRSVWMRTSTKPQDMVFSVLHIFGADIAVDYDRSVEDLILELAARTSDFPAWLYIGHDMPINQRSQLLPELPSFVPNSAPVYRDEDNNLVRVSSFIISFDYISKFLVKIKPLPDLKGHFICGQILEVTGSEDGEPGPSDREFMDAYFPGDDDSDVDDTPTIPTALHLASITGAAKVNSHVSGSVGTHMLILGETSPYRFLEFEEMAVLSYGGPCVLFFRQEDPTGVWENCGSARLDKSLTETGRKHLNVGLYPGARMTDCTCSDRPREADLKPLEAFDRPDRYKGFGYLIPGLDDDEDGADPAADGGLAWSDDEDEDHGSEGDEDPLSDGDLY